MANSFLPADLSAPLPRELLTSTHAEKGERRSGLAGEDRGRVGEMKFGTSSGLSPRKSGGGAALGSRWTPMKAFHRSGSLIIIALALLAAQTAFAQRPRASRPNAQRPNANRPNARSDNADSASADSADAKRAVDSATIVQGESALLVSTIEGFGTGGRRAPGGTTAAQVAAYIAAHAPARYSPPGCLNANVNGATVVLVFNNCTGPRGLRQVTGELAEAVSVDAAGVHVHASATQLQLGESTMAIDSTIVYTIGSGTRSMSVTTSGAGTGPLGNSIVRQGNYTITWDASCVATNGSWATTSGESSRSTTAQLKRCNHQCPTGTVTHTYGGRTITITFDGSAVAKWTTSNGKSGTINLICTP
jgi:hypothetical protein